MAASTAVILGAVLLMVTALSGTASAEPTADDWYRLRVCESGNNYAINTGNGYYGAYQFDVGTWRSVGGSGYPHQASPAVQDALALTLYRQRGWSPWACARILGLPVRPDVAAAPPKPVPPTGSIDGVQAAGYSASVVGWVLDQNAPANSIQVHIYVNNVGYAFTADKARQDVNNVMGVGGQHGFTETVPLQPGSNNVCAYAIGVNADNNSGIGCRTVQAPLLPIGNVDAMTVSGWDVNVSGWAFDPNSPGASNTVLLYVDQTGGATVANLDRPDVNSVFGIPGQHGFSINGRLNRGANSVCAYSIATGAANNSQIGCRTLQGPAAPLGSVDAVTVSGSQATVSGWALDPNSPATSIPVHIYVNNVGIATTANQPRADVNSVMRASGQHGFTQTVPLSPGANTVCAFAIGVAFDNNTLVQCRTVQGPSAALGSVDAVTVSGSQATVSGWALDPNSPATSIPVHIYVNNAGYAFTANKPRTDVNTVMRATGLHGFTESVPLTPGVNTICTFAIGVTNGNNTLISCRNVTLNAPLAQQLAVPAQADPAGQSVPAGSSPSPVTASGTAPGSTSGTAPGSTSGSVAATAAPTTSAPPTSAPSTSAQATGAPTSESAAASSPVPATTPSAQGVELGASGSPPPVTTSIAASAP